MRALTKKLWRDLRHLRGQAVAIALVIAAGVAIYVVMESTLVSLDLTQRTYYERYRFADVFASAKRAPLSLAAEIAAIPGVAQIETRVVSDVLLDVPGLVEPAVGRLVGIPAPRRAMLNDVFLRQGRYIEAGRPDEVLLSETFAKLHGLVPGSVLPAILHGRRRNLRVVGLALSPEYVYNVRPGELMPDETRFGIVWMERRALAAAYEMEGGFNDVVLRLARGASAPEVIARLDRLLEPWGGRGAIPRSLQTSHWYLENELGQLRSSGRVLPVVFLGVAAFLLNVVLTRIVALERGQIAALKALGYTNREVAAHYLGLSLLIATLGGAIGVAFGAWLGRGMTRLYTEFYHFPILEYRLAVRVAVQGTIIGLVAAGLGALGAVRGAARLPPAEALRPEPPARYRESLLERAGVKRFLSQPARMIVRNITRRPVRASLSILGIALGAAMLVVGTFSLDAMRRIVDVQFFLAQRYDAMVTFLEPTSPRALHEVERLPGVREVEPFRSVPVKLRFRHRSRQAAVLGLPAAPRLNRVLDSETRPVTLPPQGLVLSRTVADILGADRGDVVVLEVLEGARPVLNVPVADVVDEYIGTNVYAEIGALRRLMREGETLSGAFLAVDRAAEPALYRRVKRSPRVAGVLLKRATVESFEKTIARNFAIITTVNMLFAAVIAFGVVYNTARISLSERSRELATLRVIGFRRAEISYILLGELAALVALAIPAGLLLGYVMSAAILELFQTELYRIPFVIAPRTFARAGFVTLVSAAISAAAVRRRLDRLDLVAVLKTRE
ncbi:MAG TPA: FtsX-like permease family protein [Thermoanaerobaculia bacterium]|nr:FtsX-like permease family protein [Thermoanaerobaculia bacterium]